VIYLDLILTVNVVTVTNVSTSFRWYCNQYGKLL